MRPLVPVAPRVRRSLNQLASRFSSRGVRLFVFGSAAPSWPLAPAGADLDLGYEIAVADLAQRATLQRELLRALATLPTVRPIDAVNFGTAAPEFTANARTAIQPLPDGHD